MPAVRRSVPSASAARDAAASAAVNAPTRRKRAQGGIQTLLTTFEAAPLHLQDNKFILRGYRAGYNFKRSLGSMFRLHNETGNIGTHLLVSRLSSLLPSAGQAFHSLPKR